MSQNPNGPAELPTLAMDPSALPVSQLESLKFKAAQIQGSIEALRQTIEMNGLPYMPPWPEILAKYNLLISQTTNFQVALSQSVSKSRLGSHDEDDSNTLFERIVVHPKTSMSDLELDTQVAPLLRNQQTTDVLQDENETVRRIAERLHTKGSIGVLGPGQNKPEYSDVLAECEEIRNAHDSRVERAFRAVNMLRDKYQWRNWTSVVAEEEPEELRWDTNADESMPPPEDEDMDDEDEEDDENDEDGTGSNEEIEDSLNQRSSNPVTPAA